MIVTPLMGRVRQALRAARATGGEAAAALTPLLGQARRALSEARRAAALERCPACGQRSPLAGGPVLWPALIAEWGLSPEWTRWIDEREGRCCAACGVNLRSRHLARGLLREAPALCGVRAPSLAALCAAPRFRALSVAEINAAGGLHGVLSALPRLRYSEYGSRDPQVPSEDLLSLSYPDRSFDLVVTSESLEHVPDVERALGELRRVLRPGGRHVFTVPILWDRPATRRRASLRGGELVHHLPPSYHGAATTDATDLLVFYEFGRDFLPLCRRAGFTVRTLRDPRNPALVTFLTSVPP